MDTTAAATLTTPTVTSPGSTTVKVRKSFRNTMDVGTIEFDVTLSNLEEWGKANHALIQFPTYYPADLGVGLKCSVNIDGVTENIYCDFAWD